MRTSTLVAHFVFLALAVWSCGPATSFPPPAPSPVKSWSVVLAQTGGFAGVSLIVRVESDGTILAQDARTGRESARRLDEAEKKELERFLASLNPVSRSDAPSVCADCFIYDLQITRPDAVTHWKGDDITLDASGFGDLIRFLGQIRDEALSGAI